MISAFKDCLKDMNLFMQVLVVLIEYEDYYGDSNKMLF